MAAVHACDPGTQQVETEESKLWGQPGLHSETLTQRGWGRGGREKGGGRIKEVVEKEEEGKELPQESRLKGRSMNKTVPVPFPHGQSLHPGMSTPSSLSRGLPLSGRGLEGIPKMWPQRSPEQKVKARRPAEPGVLQFHLPQSWLPQQQPRWKERREDVKWGTSVIQDKEDRKRRTGKTWRGRREETRGKGRVAQKEQKRRLWSSEEAEDQLSKQLPRRLGLQLRWSSAYLTLTGPWVPSPILHKAGMAVHTSNPSTREELAGGSRRSMSSYVSLG